MPHCKTVLTNYKHFAGSTSINNNLLMYVLYFQMKDLLKSKQYRNNIKIIQPNSVVARDDNKRSFNKTLSRRKIRGQFFIKRKLRTAAPTRPEFRLSSN